MTTKIAYSMGVGYNKSLTKHFQIRSRVLFERKGFNETYDGYPDTGPGGPLIETQIKRGANFNYWTGMLMPGIMIGKKSRLGISAGGYYSQLGRAQLYSQDFRQYPTIGTVRHDVSNELDKIDIGSVFNLSYSFPFKKGDGLSFQLQYEDGLRHIDAPGPQDRRTRNRSSVFYVTYFFK